MSKQQMVKVVNPAPGWPTHQPLSVVKRWTRLRWARHDCGGRLVMLVDLPTMIRREALKQGKVKNSPALSELKVTQFCGRDAFPMRAVLPPSPEVVMRQSHKRGVLVPPLRAVDQVTR